MESRWIRDKARASLSVECWRKNTGAPPCAVFPRPQKRVRTVIICQSKILQPWGGLWNGRQDCNVVEAKYTPGLRRATCSSSRRQPVKDQIVRRAITEHCVHSAGMTTQQSPEETVLGFWFAALVRSSTAQPTPYRRAAGRSRVHHPHEDRNVCSRHETDVLFAGG